MTDAPPDAEPSTTWGPAKLLALGTALAFLVGAVGYVVGVRTAPDPHALDAVDEGFLVDMTAHHEQAVEMALLELAYGSDEVARDFAQEVVMTQRREIGIMETLLRTGEGRYPEPDPERTAMAWMDMATPLSVMPGMASPEQVASLAARGTEADVQFLELMRAHHEGGIHMGEYAEANGSNADVRALAGRMARNQAIEVREYTQLLERLGYE